MNTARLNVILLEMFDNFRCVGFSRRVQTYARACREEEEEEEEEAEEESQFDGEERNVINRCETARKIFHLRIENRSQFSLPRISIRRCMHWDFSSLR